MICYDGTWEGLLTVIFECYDVLDNTQIQESNNQMSLLDIPQVITSDSTKAQRVQQRIKETFTASFYNDCTCVFSSAFDKKGDVIAKLVKKLFQHGILFIQSAEPEAVNFRSLLKKVHREIHAYKGLLRFRELNDQTLYAPFRPEHDILMRLAPHFMRRIPNERFIIHDVGREKAVFYHDQDMHLMKNLKLNPEESQMEKSIQQAWLSFYHSVSIDERASEKRMISNMPKKHWEFLTERQTPKKDD